MHCRWKCVWNSKQRLREYLIAELAFRTAVVHEQALNAMYVAGSLLPHVLSRINRT